MPIVEIRIVGEIVPERRQGLARRLADAVGRGLGARPGATWVSVMTVPAGDYAEEGGGPPPGVHPVFIRVARKEVPTGEALAAEMAALAAAVSEVCGRPSGNVHVVYEAPLLGRVAFGGKLVT